MRLPGPLTDRGWFLLAAGIAVLVWLGWLLAMCDGGCGGETILDQPAAAGT